MTPSKIELNANYQKAWNLIEKSSKVFLTTHEGTDGDDLGSLLAMKQVLEEMGKTVVAGVKKGVPKNLAFLPESDTVGDAFVPGDYDLYILFGCGKPERPGFEQLLNLQAPLINFDHHPDNTMFGTVNVVDPATAAVAELIYYFLLYKKIKIDHAVATSLLTGIFTDTGGFKHANTSAEALEVAAVLLKKGARIDRISQLAFGQRRPEALKVWSRALENTRFDPNKQMVFSVMTEDDLKELGATEDDLAGFAELLNHIPQAKFAMMLRQDGDMVKASLRSELHKGTDVSKIAHSFGGGGHKLAAGFSIKGKLHREGDSWVVKPN